MSAWKPSHLVCFTDDFHITDFDKKDEDEALLIDVVKATDAIVTNLLETA